MNGSTTTATPRFFFGTLLPATVFNSLLTNFSNFCNDRGMIYLDQSNPRNTQYKCVCDRIQALTKYPPCIQCLNVAGDPKNECAHICWPNTYVGDRCNKIVCSPGAKATIGNSTCACKQRRRGNFCETAECGTYGQTDGYGGCVCHESNSSVPLNEFCDPPCDANHGYWNGTFCDCYANYTGQNCSTGDCHGRGDWNVFEDRCQCANPQSYTGKFCELYIVTAWYNWWYLWTAVVIFVLVLFALGIFVQYFKRIKQRSVHAESSEDVAAALRRQHEKERDELAKQHEVARAKMDHKLQEKLEIRRLRLPPINGSNEMQNNGAPWQSDSVPLQSDSAPMQRDSVPLQNDATFHLPPINATKEMPRDPVCRLPPINGRNQMQSDSSLT